MKTPLIVVLGVLLGALPSLAGELDVRIETVPPGARVEQAGRVLGQTPLTLKYPTGYFQTRATVWGAYLGAPLELTFTLAGYQPKDVKLGRGPFPWRNLYGVILYQYYLLDRSYRIELMPQDDDRGKPAVDQVTQLERLATLRAQGVLTEEEFQTAKARVLTAPQGQVATAKPLERPRNQLDGQDPTGLCWRLIANAFTGSEFAKPRTPTRQESTTTDGSDRQVSITCSWDLTTPRPSILSVAIECGDKADTASLCHESSQSPGEGNPACLWGTEVAAQAIAKPGCLMTAALTVDRRRSAPPGFENSSTVDVREVLRTMAGRIGS